ncbi:MAG: CRISPR-associated endonuclease Cas2, partial [Candidatus Jettenia caeni]|nr:CRISPR-associated endonuclease Cas2 [Candidatus Jettenia caeni]
MKSNYIVCYDITHEKRLRQVFKTLKGIGTHIQYSVFFCKLTWQELTGLKEKL